MSPNANEPSYQNASVLMMSNINNNNSHGDESTAHVPVSSNNNNSHEKINKLDVAPAIGTASGDVIISSNETHLNNNNSNIISKKNTNQNNASNNHTKNINNINTEELLYDIPVGEYLHKCH